MKPLKAFVKRNLPPSVLLFRYTLYNRIRYLPELITSLGNCYVCPFCGWRFRRFLPAGVNSPCYTRVRVIPGGRRPHVLCPRCYSNDRERLVYLYLRNRTEVFSGGLRILHVAPEPCLRRALVAQSRPAMYVTADLEMRGVHVRLDLTRIPFATGTFDVVVCNHVLEHVPDDGKAMCELARVLRPGGWGILQVPIAPDLDATIDGPPGISPDEKLIRFGQKDHVRLYGWDYLDRLRTAGFEAEARDCIRELGEDLVKAHALLPDERLVIVRKPAAGE